MDYWGKAGAGIIFFSEDRTVLLVLRSRLVREPLTWGAAGGSVEEEGYFDKNSPRTIFPPTEFFWKGALREAEEELGNLPNNITVFDIIEFSDSNFKFINFLAMIPLTEKNKWDIQLNWENEDYKWFPVSQLPEKLHYGIKYVASQRPNIFYK